MYKVEIRVGNTRGFFVDYFNSQVIESIDIKEIKAKKSFPWVSIHEILTPEGFAALHRDFPPVDLFQYHDNISRYHTKQRPHNRYYASLNVTSYPELVEETGKGLLHTSDLERSWQEFVHELVYNTVYQKLILEMLDVRKFGFQLVWHIGIQGNEVCPHLDAERKTGTHLFYFNSSNDWSSQWGGEFLVLEGKKVPQLNPEVEDFETVTSAPIVDNHSLLFKNTENAWHGVRPLNCPEGKQRRLANVIFYKTE